MRKRDRAGAAALAELRDRRSKGEWAEAAFLTKAVGLGLTACRPFCDHYRFDFVVLAPSGKVSRVQVKSTWRRHNDTYSLDLKACVRRPYRGGIERRPYRADEVDFLVGYVAPEDVWYVFPVGAAAGTVCVFPHVEGSRGKWERYREAWHLLSGLGAKAVASSEGER